MATRLEILPCWRYNLVATVALAVALTVSQSANAQAIERLESAFQALQEGFASLFPDEMREDFSVNLGFGAGVLPDYDGSDNYRIRVLPLIDINYKDTIELNGTKLNYTFFRDDTWRVRSFLNWHTGRNERRNAALEGIGNVGNTMQLGGAVEYRYGLMLAQLDVRQALYNGQGFVARLTLGSGVYRDEKWLVGVGARATFSDDDHMDTFFSITPEQAANSVAGLREFDAGSGLSEVGTYVLARYSITAKWRAEGLIGVARLLGDAEDSPITKDFGSPTQVQVSAGLRYRF